MGSLSSYEIEQICESCYNQAVEFFSRYDYISDADSFASTVEDDFVDWANPQLNYRISQSQISIVHKWRYKLRTEAKMWYAQNVERARENERRERLCREQEERDREEQAQYERARRREMEAEENRRRLEEKRIREAEEERQRKEEERRRAEEKRRRAEEEALARAKRKEQNKQNKQRLSEIQAQWKARSDSTQQTSTQPQTSASVETATCPHCGGPVRKTAKFCVNCGTKLSATCSSCGATLKPSAKFCSDCGAPVSNL